MVNYTKPHRVPKKPKTPPSADRSSTTDDRSADDRTTDDRLEQDLNESKLNKSRKEIIRSLFGGSKWYTTQNGFHTRPKDVHVAGIYYNGKMIATSTSEKLLGPRKGKCYGTGGIDPADQTKQCTKHAEPRLIRKLNRDGWGANARGPTRGPPRGNYTLAVIRLSRQGDLGSSRPCSACVNAILKAIPFVGDVLYMDPNGQFVNSTLEQLCREARPCAKDRLVRSDR